MRALFVIYNPVTTLHSRYNFVLQLYENAHVFSQSEARNFFVYIIIVCLCMVGVILTLFAQTSVCKSSILFFIHFSIKSWQGEVVHNHEFLFSVITSSNFMAFIFDPGLILLGEIRCQSLLVVKSDMFKDCKALQKKKPWPLKWGVPAVLHAFCAWPGYCTFFKLAPSIVKS